MPRIVRIFNLFNSSILNLAYSSMNSTFTFELCNHLDERYRRGKSYLPVEISDQVRKN